MKKALIVLFALAGCGANQLPNHLDGATGVKQVFLGGSAWTDMWFETLSNNNVPMALQHWNGTALAPVPIPTTPIDAHMTCGKGGCFFTGSSSYLARLDSSGTLTDLTSSIPSANATSRSVSASDDTTWLIQFEGATASLYTWNGTAFAAVAAPPDTANPGNLKPITDTLAFIPERNGPGAYRFDGTSWQSWQPTSQGFGGSVNLSNLVSLGAGGVFSVATAGGISFPNPLAPAGTGKTVTPWELDHWTGSDFEHQEITVPDSWMNDGASYTGRALAVLGGKLGAIHWRVDKDPGSPTENHSIVFNAINGTQLGPNVVLQNIPTCDLGCTVGFVDTLPDGTVVTDTGGSQASLAWGKPSL